MPRLYHTKSKNGCSRCRARRVKCDEIRPNCGGCQRHKVHCVYDRHVQPSVSSPASAVETNSHQKGRIASGVIEESRERRYRELQLLHFFKEDICPTLPGTCLPEILDLWRSDCPRLSFDYEPLLNGIFALSILGMRWIGSGATPSLGDLSTLRAQYFEATLQSHRKAVGFLTHDTADAVCLTSNILALDAFASMRDRVLDDSTYVAPMEWLQLSVGVRSMFRNARTLVQDNPNSVTRRMMEYGDHFVKASNADPASNRAGFAYLLDPLDKETKISQDGKAYEDTVVYIGSIWKAQEQGQHMMMQARGLLVFSILANPRFLELVEALDALALVILAHFFAVAVPNRQLWWIGHSPAREILAIGKHLGSEWRREMRWPIEMAQQQ